MPDNDDSTTCHAALQGLRALVALAIMSNHWTDHRYDGLIPQQQIAVDFFFAIEGFLAASTLGQFGSSPWTQHPVSQRLFRVYPLYFLGLLAGAVTVSPLVWSSTAGWTVNRVWQAVLAGVVGVPSFTPAATGAVFPCNPPSWAIVLEVWVFAALWWLRARLSLRALFALCATAAVVLAAFAVMRRDVNPGWEGHDYLGGVPRVAFGFFVGVLLSRMTETYGARLPRLNPILIWIAFVAVLFVKVRFAGLPLLFIAMPVIVWLGSVAVCPAWLRGFCRQAGRHAYALYLLHFPVLAALNIGGTYLELTHAEMAGPMSYAVALATVIAVSVLATRLFDEPLRRWITAK